MSLLEEMYNATFMRFRKGWYHRVGGKRLNGKKRKRLSEAKTHIATLDYMLWEWCELQGLKHNKYYKTIYVPRWLNQKHEEVKNLIAGELAEKTKKRIQDMRS